MSIHLFHLLLNHSYTIPSINCKTKQGPSSNDKMFLLVLRANLMLYDDRAFLQASIHLWKQYQTVVNWKPIQIQA